MGDPAKSVPGPNGQSGSRETAHRNHELSLNQCDVTFWCPDQEPACVTVA